MLRGSPPKAEVVAARKGSARGPLTSNAPICLTIAKNAGDQTTSPFNDVAPVANTSSRLRCHSTRFGSAGVVAPPRLVLQAWQ